MLAPWEGCRFPRACWRVVESNLQSVHAVMCEKSRHYQLSNELACVNNVAASRVQLNLIF